MDGLIERVAAGREDRWLLPSARARLRGDQPDIFAAGEGMLWDPSHSSVFAGYDPEDEVTELSAEDLGWIPLGGLSIPGSPIRSRLDLLRECVSRYYRDPVAHNIITAYVHFIVGEGFNVESESEGAGEEFEEWAEEHDWADSVELATRTAVLLGESYFVLYRGDGPLLLPNVRDDDGPTSRPQPTSTEPATAFDQFRVLDPFRIPRVKTNPEDVDEVWGYAIRRPDGRLSWLHPDGVVRLRFDRMVGLADGMPVLQPALVPLSQLSKHAENRYFLNWVRARFPVIRKITSPTANLATEKARTVYKTLPKPATVVFEKGPVEWQFPSLNIGASDVWDDWRTLVLRVAAAVSLPEYLVVMDASNATFSSTLVAESPAHHLFRSLQRTVARALEKVLLRFFPERDIEVVPSPIVPRDPNNKAQALGALVDRRILSRQTAATDAGYEWDGPDGERARMERERMQAMAEAPDTLRAAAGLPARGGMPPFGRSAAGNGNGKGRGGAEDEEE